MASLSYYKCMAKLLTCPIFQSLSSRDLDLLRQKAVLKIFKDGEVVFQEGDEGDGLYVINRGKVQIAGVVAKNVRHVYSRFGEGDFFGEMAVLESKPRSATAIAIGDTEVYFITKQDLLALMPVSPELALGLVREVSRRLREFNRLYLQEILQQERLSLVGRFARSIVHDLKNPLNIISLSAEVASSDKATPEFRKKANDRIGSMVERITALVNELLEFTNNTSKNVFVGAAIDYAAFVHHLVVEMRPEIELKSTHILLENEPPSIRLNLDPKRLKRVFYNLMHNATDAMEEGGTIRLRFRILGDVVETELEDSGPGIAPEVEDQLFDAFVTFGKENGTGLGLSICKKIVEDHGGRIAARTEPGRGAIFVFTLPMPGK